MSTTLADDFRKALIHALKVKSVYQVSKETGVDQSLLGRYAKGEQTITLETASRIAPAIGVSLLPEKIIPK